MKNKRNRDINFIYPLTLAVTINAYFQILFYKTARVLILALVNDIEFSLLSICNRKRKSKHGRRKKVQIHKKICVIYSRKIIKNCAFNIALYI